MNILNKQKSDLSKMELEIQQKMRKLAEKIEQHNYRYYILAEPIISDYEYDLLFKQLQDLEKNYPHLRLPYSPTYKIGALDDSKHFRKEKLEYRMYSLDNVYNINQLINFLKKIKEKIKDAEFIAEHKFDGLAINIIYKDGVFLKGLTRGNGYIGEDISNNVKVIKNIPLILKRKIKGIYHIRGEVLLFKKDLERINKERKQQGLPLFANCRNAAAGTLRSLSSKVVADRNLYFKAYELKGDISKLNLKTQADILNFLKDIGFSISDYKIFKDLEIIDYINDLKERKNTFLYDVDGIVFKVNQLRYQELLGYTEKVPKWAIAYKFPAVLRTTYIKDVVFSVGRTGIITPVAILEPVEIEGVIVKKATLHNFEEIKRKDIKIFDKVFVQRAGKVIPEIVKSIKQERTGKEKDIIVPDKCPVCFSKVVKDINEVYYRCSGLNCPAKLINSVIHYASGDAIDIKFLGKKLVKQLVEKNIIKKISDLYKLKIEDLLKLDRMANKLAEKILNSINNAKKRPLYRFLYALGIANIGKKASMQLAGKFKTIYNIKKAKVEDLISLKDFGKVMAESVFKFFSDEKNWKEILLLKSLQVFIQEKEENENLPFKDLQFAITGTLSRFKRKEAISIIEKLGGKVLSLSNKTNYLLVGAEPGSKLNKAKEKGIKILNEDKFYEILDKYYKEE